MRGRGFREFLRRFSVRQRLLAMVVLLATAMTLPVVLSVVGQNRMLDERQRVTETLVKAANLMLGASTRIAASQAGLARYLEGIAPGPDDALVETDAALARLEAAKALVGPDQASQIEALRLEVMSYQELIGRLHAARLEGHEDETADLVSQSPGA